MSLKFKDILNRPFIMTAEIVVIVIGIACLLIIKFKHLNNIESLFILPIFVIQLYLLKELAYCMNLEVTDTGISYTGKKSNWIKFKPKTDNYRWDEVRSVDLSSGTKIITIHFSNGDKIKFISEPDYSQKFLDKVRMYCPDMSDALAMNR